MKTTLIIWVIVNPCLFLDITVIFSRVVQITNRYFGENPEEKVGSVMDRFIRGEGLYEKKPDSRLFGFNPADGEGDDRSYSYENWVTIPEDLEVPAPLAKKRFAGGLYAAYAIRFPDFQEWEFLKSWAKYSAHLCGHCFLGTNVS